jgi:hypothetical protein
MTRQKLGLVVTEVPELAFDSFSDMAVKRPARCTQQSAIGCILYQGVLEKISRVRCDALSEILTQRAGPAPN